MNIEQLKALSKAEINEMCAIKVMKWETSLSWGGSHWIAHIVAVREKTRWNPATDMNDAMMVLKKVKKTFYIARNEERGYVVSFGEHGENCEGCGEYHFTIEAQAHDHKAPLAICCAALMAIGGE